MELPASPSSHQFNTRKPGEPGLAEWAQKIRALQHQVDQDEEEEHRKLEQEIAASRLARVRRSTGYGRVPLDPPAVPSDSPSTASRHSDAPEAGSSSIVRRGEQTEALQKFVGKPSLRPQTTPSSPAPMSLAAFIGGRATGPRLNKHAPQMDATDHSLFEQRSINTSSAPHPVFGRGGIAMPGLTSRGRGVVSPIEDHGVDQPAPTASSQVHSPIVKHEPASNTEPALVSKSDRGLGGEASHQPRTGTSSMALKRYVQHVEKVTSTQATKPSPECDAPRPRTVSTPNPTDTHRARSTTLPPPILSSRVHSGSPHGRIPPRSPDLDARSPPPTFDSSLPSEKSPTFPPSKPSGPTFITPKKPAITSSPASGAKLPTFSASTPSFPRPEASTQKAIPLTPQRRMPSLHPPKEKDPTPSISRLKGRGFVQSMVKASSVLEAAAAGSATPEAGKPSPAQSSPSITNRWKPESSCSSPSQPGRTSVPTNYRKSWTPSVTTPSPQRTVAQRKSWTTSESQKVEESERERPARTMGQERAGSVRVVESNHTGRPKHATEHQHAGQPPLMPGSEQTEHPPRKAPSLPSLSTPSRPNTPPPASPGGHGLGSSSTMFSYIKPMKTGDDPATSPSLPHSRPTTPHSRVSAGGLEFTQDVDELGHRTGVSSGGRRQRNGVAGFPAPSGRPLVHLTKGRPKPKKANRRDTGERLAEARTMTTLAPLPHVRTCGISKAAVPTPSSTHITSSATRLFGTASHADVPTQSSTHLPTSKRDVLGANATDRWDVHGLIGVPSSDSAAAKPQEETFLVGLTRPLPGLSIPSPPSPLGSQVQPPSPSPRSPRRQSRIPSTGSRTLVMDVAQALQEAQAPMTEAGSSSKGSVPVAAQRQAELHAPPIEKRKSGPDKYMDRVMPPLVEERTATIRGATPELVTRVDIKIKPDVRVQERGSPDDILPVQPGDNYVEIPHHDEPLPRVDLDKLFFPVSAYQPSADVTTISIDIMSVTGATATGVKGDTDVFYDSEILAIVHRAKAKSGLVETTLWGWQGRRSQIGEREQRKLKDMARHYGTKLCPVHQGCEPAELVHALGGRLAIRQGMRSYWSAENTTMHQVRLMNGLVSIDEHDFHVSNLCSAFSYCLTLLGTCYVWHGKGSLSGERQAALEYALSLVTGSRPVELVEQVSDDNEMFWMMLGDADYARADYWKWRPDLAATALPRIWRVDTSSTSGPHLTIVPAFSTESNIDLSVYLLDCIWELFILVGTKARKARRDIRLALSIARDLSSRLATDRPFMPPIHILVLPSKIPLDLRLHFRDLDEELMNGTPPPDHMNLLELSEALSDLERIKWEKTRLKDLAMLPLGIDPTCLP